MDDAKFKKEIGDTVVNKCIEALGRIRAGIQLLVEDDISFDAFCFMNRSMILQRNIMNFSKKHGAGIECAFRDFVDPRNSSNNFGWRPFQIAFILMNLKGIVDPEHDNREVVDLLYFPTGGGKTEAYLGLMAFVIANRRLRTNESDEYNRDGGVTAILRYTLRASYYTAERPYHQDDFGRGTDPAKRISEIRKRTHQYWFLGWWYCDSEHL